MSYEKKEKEGLKMIHTIYLAKGLINNDQTIYFVHTNGQISAANNEPNEGYVLNKSYGRLLEKPKSLAQNECLNEYTRVFRLDTTSNVMQELEEVAPNENEKVSFDKYLIKLNENQEIVIISETWTSGWVGLLQKNGNITKIAKTKGYA